MRTQPQFCSAEHHVREMAKGKGVAQAGLRINLPWQRGCGHCIAALFHGGIPYKGVYTLGAKASGQRGGPATPRVFMSQPGRQAGART